MGKDGAPHLTHVYVCVWVCACVRVHQPEVTLDDAAVVSDGVFFKEAKYQKVIKTSENCFEYKIIEV